MHTDCECMADMQACTSHDAYMLGNELSCVCVCVCMVQARALLQSKQLDLALQTARQAFEKQRTQELQQASGYTHPALSDVGIAFFCWDALFKLMSAMPSFVSAVLSSYAWQCMFLYSLDAW